MSGVSYGECREAKFCGNCGHSLPEELVVSGAREEEQQAGIAQVKEPRQNEKVKQTKRFASGYFQFLNML